jgi:acyl-CoA thioesterase I
MDGRRNSKNVTASFVRAIFHAEISRGRFSPPRRAQPDCPASAIPSALSAGYTCPVMKLNSRPLRFWRAALAAAWFLAGDPARAATLRVLAFGDSVTAGYGLEASDAYPAQLERRLRKDGFDVVVENGGVSGNTTQMGRARFAATLGAGADLVILELGGNDMLNSIDPRITKANLEKMIRLARARGARVLLAGMIDLNPLRPATKQRFDALYPQLAAKYDLPLYPFILEGVAGDKEYAQQGWLHPTAEGAARIVDKIAPLVEAMLTVAIATPKAR